jgi:hypothetical protein
MGCITDGAPVNNVKVISPVESNGSLPVNVSDQNTPPIDAYMLRSLSNFNIVVDTVASGHDAPSLVYQFTASPAHGIAPLDELLLLDVAADRSFFCEAVSVLGDVITIDRPIDWAFPVLSTLGRIVSSKMNVDGSVTPKIFSIRAGTIPTDNVRFILTGLNNVDLDNSKFIGLPKLTRGLVLRIINTFQKTIFCFKTDGEIAQFSYDAKKADRAPAGLYGLSARFTFGGQDKHGVVLRIQDTDVIQWVVQDDLTGLNSLQISVQGHETTD